MIENSNIDTARSLATSLGYVISEDFIALCGITEGTADSWRKRGKGPKYALIGKRYVYPVKSISEWLEAQLGKNIPRAAPARNWL